ncbi:MAG: glycosyltransferase family 2 protein [Legionellaceae bacterium]|nr:glycosyltransferase family 2 protein [Legionellaceae bacterium]
MMYSTIKLSVIAPMFNEEAVIEAYLEKTLEILNNHFQNYELILIDDGSTDRTVSRCLSYIRENKRIRLISFSRNYGHEIASTAGLETATGDLVILMDTDLQHPPELIPDMVAKASQGYDVVCALRTNRDEESWFKKTTAKLFYGLSRKMTGFDLNADTGNFRLISRKVVDSLNKMKENNRHLIMMFAYVGYKTANISFHCPPRAAGKTKYNIRKLIKLSLDSIIGFSSRPLRLMSMFSVMISIIMMVYAGFILIQKLFTHQQLADGMASIIFLISGLFSVLFLFLAIISEYISRILIETKNRPLYNIKQDITYETISQLSE